MKCPMLPLFMFIHVCHGANPCINYKPSEHRAKRYLRRAIAAIQRSQGLMIYLNFTNLGNLRPSFAKLKVYFQYVPLPTTCVKSLIIILATQGTCTFKAMKHLVSPLCQRVTMKWDEAYGSSKRLCQVAAGAPSPHHFV